MTRAAKIYETIGVYLGYAIAHYADFYDFQHAADSGPRHDRPGRRHRARQSAAKFCKQEFPEVAAKIELHVPDEKSRRVGQAVAAASLPALKK